MDFKHLGLVAVIVCPFYLLNASADTIDDAPRSAADGCPVLPHEIALDSELGSVGFMKNIAEHPESIRAVAERLLSKALQTREFKEQPQCGETCRGTLRAQIVYRVEPTVFMPEEKQQAVCLTFEEQTKLEPMRFDPKEFDSLDKLNDWIMAFSQGRGDDGKALYDRCSANCSPRYTFYITNDAEQLAISTEVLCGLARDRKSDQYLVSTAIRWQCLND